ncbi:hypothetical protein ON010_g15014 [Phytophthora cinnamomi]|nr:hypothetical protein ON010_g15014 [Phytophthora cinnamomi]
MPRRKSKCTSLFGRTLPGQPFLRKAEGSTAKSAMQARISHGAAMAAAAKKNRDGRGMVDDSFEAEPSGKKKAAQNNT